MKTKLILLAVLGLLSVLNLTAAPLVTAFTYPGKLADGGLPANGLYDFQFALHDAATGGSPVANAALNGNAFRIFLERAGNFCLVLLTALII